MRIEAITVGDELLDGRVVDGNSALLGERLARAGRSLARVGRGPDTLDEVVALVRDAAERADACVVSGGLGPTDDDLTLDALARAAGVGFDFEPAAWAHIERVFAGRTPPETNRRQCRVPHGGRSLPTEVGTAPGVALKIGRCTFYALPGVPHEFEWMLDRYVLPELAGGAPTPSRTLTFAFIGESDLQARVSAAGLPDGVRVMWRTRGPENDVTLVADDVDLLASAARQVVAAVPERHVPEGDLARAVLARCAAHGYTVGTAESCTGGLTAGRLTAVPGSSEVVYGGVVAYSNAVKTAVLGVPEDVLEAHGAVSEPCAVAMARGARAALGCDVSVAITGVAGPGGGTPDKPVGTVCFAWSGPDMEIVRTRRFRGDRERVRHYAVAYALDGLRRALDAH